MGTWNSHFTPWQSSTPISKKTQLVLYISEVAYQLLIFMVLNLHQIYTSETLELLKSKQRGSLKEPLT